MDFPQPEPDDNDDVAWAIQTANTMYKRGDHAEAIRWLQRAADAAEEAGDDRRLLMLARAAAEFAAPRANAAAPAAKPSAPPAATTTAAPAPPAATTAAQPKPSAPPAAMPAPQRPAPAFKRSAPAPTRSAPPPLQRSAPPPRKREPSVTEITAEEVTPLSTAPSAPPPAPEPAPRAATAEPRVDRLSATATPTTKLEPAARRRLEGLSAGATPTTPAVPQRLTRPSEVGEEVTHVFKDPQTENTKSTPRASATPLSPSGATRSPLPLRRPFMSSATGVSAQRDRGRDESHAIHDSSPQPHRALRVCVLRATSPGTFLVRPLSPGEPLPPNGREALLVPINPDDDFSH